MKRLCFSALLICFLSAAPARSVEVVSRITFNLTRQRSESDELLSIAQRLTTIRENKVLDSVRLKESVEALYDCRLFESVEVKTSGGQIIFELTPARYVRDIKIKGAHPLFTDEVEVAMNTYPGDIFYDEMLLWQDSLVTELYKREGFVSPTVEVTSVAHSTGEDRVINVLIDAGDYHRLKTVTIEGNRAVSDLGIKRRMKSWHTSLFPGRAGRFLEADLQEDIAGLTEFYRSRRFADIHIRDSVVIDSQDNSVHLVLTVDEGDRYRIQFSPASERGFRKRVLKKNITIFRNGNRNNLGLRNSVRAISRRMRESGYLDAHIEYSDTTIEKRRYTERIVYLDINSGTRTTVDTIAIAGAKRIDKKVILEQMLHVDWGRASRRAYHPEKLEEDVLAIQMLYRSRGFLNANVSSNVVIEEKSAFISIEIDEGTQSRVGEVNIDDTDLFAEIDMEKVITVREGDIFSRSLLNQNARSLQQIIAEKGYPHVGVSPVVGMNNDSSRADVHFKITEGPVVVMGDVRYIGAFRTRERVLNRELKTSTGEPLSLRDVIATQKTFRDMGIFSSSRFRTIGLREKWDTVQVFVEVAELPHFYGSFGAGYQSDEGLFVNTKVGDRNMMGLNEDGYVSAEVSTIGYRGEVALLDPRLFGTNLRALIGIYGESIEELNLNWGHTAYGVSGGMNAPFGRHTVLGLATSYERRRLDGAPPDSLLERFGDDRWRNRIITTPSFSYDRRDSFTRPRRGIYLGSSVDISSSLGRSLDDFVKVAMEARGYISPLENLTFAGVVRGGIITPYGRETVISVDQLFFLGGTQNIRGFDKNLFDPDTNGGSATLSASIEARIELELNIELTLFGDIGRLENDFSSLSADQFRSSFGLGLRYLTPIGPIGVLYGHKTDRKSGEKPGAFHFSVGYTF